MPKNKQKKPLAKVKVKVDHSKIRCIMKVYQVCAPAARAAEPDAAGTV